MPYWEKGRSIAFFGSSVRYLVTARNPLKGLNNSCVKITYLDGVSISYLHRAHVFPEQHAGDGEAAAVIRLGL